MKKFLQKLSFLLSPMALGLYITLAFTWWALLFFTSQGLSTDQIGPLESLLITAHQKSIDFRLKARGERKGSSQVALLTVDDRAVQTVGRWPWPRETIANAIENAIKWGAKVIAFDVVFSEPSANSSQQVLNLINSVSPLPEPLQQKIQTQINEKNPDQILSQTLARFPSQIVLGAFGSINKSPHGLFDSCFDLIFNASPEYKLWTEKETPIIALENRPDLPETLKSFYRDHLNHIDEAVREGRKTNNSLELHDLNQEVLQRKIQFCANWLDPKNDETYSAIDSQWSHLVEIEGKEFQGKYPTFSHWVETYRSENQNNAVPNVLEWTMNLPSLSQSSENYNTAYFNADQDPDGTIRKTHLILRSGSTYVPSLALKAFLLATHNNAKITFVYHAPTQRNEISKFEITDENGDPVGSIPVDASGRLAINYAGRQKMFPHISLADLLTESDTLTYEEREFDPLKKRWITATKKAKKADIIKDKVFILGATATGIYDLRVTPFEENYPGAETHANVLDNLLRSDFLKQYPNEERLMLLILLGLGIFLSISLAYLSALPGLTLVCLLLLGMGLVDRFFIFNHGTIVTIVLPLALTLTLFIFLISYRYLTEEKSKRELKGTFQKYVSPAIVEEILSDPSKIELGGRKARVTIFFSDVRGFTTISEKLDPRALSDLLNEYLTPMTELVFKNNGTLDKYMGDAIMAFFGAPLSFSHHAKSACRCALQSIDKLFQLQNEFKKRGLPEIDIGIGLNTGEVSVGNMGSQTVRSYTVMGDAVNLASRLEGINKQYGTRIIISEFTYNEVKDSFTSREVDWVRVKGKNQPVKIYELICEGTPEPEVENLLLHFNQGYHLYHQMKWALALDEFTKALQTVPTDEVTKLYIERCQEYLIDPPETHWDGVFVMKTK